MKDACLRTYCSGCSCHPCLDELSFADTFHKLNWTYLSWLKCPFLGLWSTKVFCWAISLLPTRRVTLYSCREYRLRSGPWFSRDPWDLSHCSGRMFLHSHWHQAILRIWLLWPWCIDLQSMGARWCIWNRHFLFPKQAKVSCDTLRRLRLSSNFQQCKHTAPMSYWYWVQSSVLPC